MLSIQTIDLDFLGIQNAIACYLIKHAQGGILIECGPGSTTPGLESHLQASNLTVRDITDVFVTHIHLDHAGAAGWLARHGARVHVHPVGAPHLLNPEKLLASAQRTYGEQMERLWGKILPVPEGQINILEDNQVVEINGIAILPIDTPGHANHHFVYQVDEICFSGDIGGIRMPGLRHLRLPMPPPEFNLERWVDSLRRLQNLTARMIAPTHFGIFADFHRHLDDLENVLFETGKWIEEIMRTEPNVEEINLQLLKNSESRAKAQGLGENDIQKYETANPTWMSGYGIRHYWNKFRSSTT